MHFYRDISRLGNDRLSCFASQTNLFYQKKKIPLPVLLQDTSGCCCLFLKRKFYYKICRYINEIPPKNLCLFQELYHYIYKLQRIFYHVVQLCARVIFKKIYTMDYISHDKFQYYTHTIASFLRAFEDVSKCQIIRILRQKFWQYSSSSL